jgi:hypothetical protein
MNTVSDMSYERGPEVMLLTIAIFVAVNLQTGDVLDGRRLDPHALPYTTTRRVEDM